MKRVIIKIALSTALIPLILSAFPPHIKGGTSAYNELQSPQSSLINENARMLWFQRKAYLEQALTIQAAAEMEKLLEQQNELSRSERREFAAALVMEGDLHIARGEIPRARVSYQTALELEPILPAAYYGLARSYWQKGSRSPFKALKEFVKGGFSNFKDLKSLYIIIINLASLLWFTAIIAAFLFVVSKLLKYQKSLRHDISEYLSARLSLAMAHPLSWGVLLLPLFLWLGVAWIMAYWIILLWLYFQKSEKVLGVISLIILILAIPSGNLLNSLYSSVHSPYILSSLYSIEGDYNLDNIENLSKVLTENSDDLDARFLLAQQYDKGKRLELAFEEYQIIINRQPGFAKAYTNVANIFFALGEYNLAIENYKRAIALRKDQVIPHYNMALAYAENLQFKYAQDAMEQARNVDLEFVDQHQEDPTTARLIVEEELPRRTLWRRLFKGIFLTATPSGTTSPVGSSLTRFFVSTLLNPTTLLGLLSLAVIILIQLTGKEKRLARLCQYCGRPFCYRCKTSIEAPDYCSQCHHIFVKKKGVSQDVKIQKSIEVQRHQFWEKLKKYLLTLIFPGFGHQYGQQPIAGFLILIVWLFGLTLTIILPGLIPIAIQLPEPSWGVGRVIGLIMCLLTYPLALGTLQKD